MNCQGIGLLLKPPLSPADILAMRKHILFSCGGGQCNVLQTRNHQKKLILVTIEANWAIGTLLFRLSRRMSPSPWDLGSKLCVTQCNQATRSHCSQALPICVLLVCRVGETPESHQSHPSMTPIGRCSTILSQTTPSMWSTCLSFGFSREDGRSGR